MQVDDRRKTYATIADFVGAWRTRVSCGGIPSCLPNPQVLTLTLNGVFFRCTEPLLSVWSSKKLFRLECKFSIPASEYFTKIVACTGLIDFHPASGPFYHAAARPGHEVNYYDLKGYTMGEDLAVS